MNSPDFSNDNVSDDTLYQSILDKFKQDVYANALIFDKADTFIHLMECTRMTMLSIPFFNFDPNFEFSNVLDICAYFGSINCFKYLISKLDIKQISSQNTFRCACIGGNMEIVRICVQNNLYRDILSFAWAIRTHNDEIADWLAETTDFIDLYHPTVSGNIKRVIPLLTQENLDDECKKLIGGISAACQISNIILARFILKHVRYPYEHISPLYESIVSGNVELVKEIMNFDKDINKVSNVNQTPLSLAINHGYMDIAQFLIENGASIDKSLEDNFCTHSLVTHFDVLKLFVEHGLDVNRKFSGLQGETLLLTAIQNGRMDSIQYLIEKGANLYYRDRHNRSAMHHAVLGANLEILQFLIEKGFDIDDKDEGGETPLQLLAEFIVNVPKEYQDGTMATKVRNALKLGANPVVSVYREPAVIDEEWIRNNV
ncbi:hypothetical protein TVAG_388150 [Trichomonas vaginalis G3]|uniref:DUF3447 domain-containing protein n=1 Tax=Trichomonas vaginalis (strain ATCC PRA-98 / G3) TaxID=412133 RepID=A2E141_TRIV3|nr:protein ubiquitination [Trichomonas vaginalis G3]EAY13673.1 hypothetical protein TVAG_388150 [Trichomonas vaginalis G3]KAI5529948.1 protein ubiquitination [Trichomonas vaginalis G3]|eukprot:XP_001325896.1 hypothetical protein [Trichomonas vaginalis G3]